MMEIAPLFIEAVLPAQPDISFVERYGSMGVLAVVVLWGLRRIVDHLAHLTKAVDRNTRTLDRVAGKVGLHTESEE